MWFVSLISLLRPNGWSPRFKIHSSFENTDVGWVKMVASYFWLLEKTKWKQLALNAKKPEPRGGACSRHGEDTITLLVYSQSDDPVWAWEFVSECVEWMRAGSGDKTASKFRQGRPGLALDRSQLSSFIHMVISFWNRHKLAKFSSGRVYLNVYINILINSYGHMLHKLHLCISVYVFTHILLYVCVW